MPGNGGENVAGAGDSGSACGGNFAAGIHQAAVTDGSKDHGERDGGTDDGGAQIASAYRYGAARTKGHIVEDAAVFAEGYFAVGAAVEIVEDDFGQAATCGAAEITDVDDAR